MAELITRELVDGVWRTTDGSFAASSGPPPAALGSPVLRGPFSFAFDTPGLADGVTVYTPTVADVLIGGFIVPTTPFNGTAAIADFSTFIGSTSGLLQLTGVGTTNLQEAVDNYGGLGRSKPGIGEYGQAFVVTIANPVKLVVSQEGTKGGTPIDATVGAATLYIVTATPVAF